MTFIAAKRHSIYTKPGEENEAAVPLGPPLRRWYSPFVVEPADIFSMISTKLRANTIAVLDESSSARLTPHEAAYALAQKRVLEAMRLRRQAPKAATEAIDVFV